MKRRDLWQNMNSPAHNDFGNRECQELQVRRKTQVRRNGTDKNKVGMFHGSLSL